jgi:hypothetical protein
VTLVAQPTASGRVPSTNNLAADSTHVYWSNYEGTVMAVSVMDRATTVIAAASPDVAVAVDATSVYWTTEPQDILASPTVPEAIEKAPLCGGAITTLATAFDLFSSYTTLAVNDTSVFFGSYTVVAAPLVGGGTRVTLIADQIGNALAVDATNVYNQRGNETDSVAWPLVKTPLAGGTPVTLAPLGSYAISAVTVDATNVYWTEYSPHGENSGVVMSVPIAGGVATTLAAHRPGPKWMAIDSTYVYWLEHNDVLKAPLSGGGLVTTLATSGSYFTGVAVTDASVVWSDWSGLYAITPK